MCSGILMHSKNNLWRPAQMQGWGIAEGSCVYGGGGMHLATGLCFGTILA